MLARKIILPPNETESMDTVWKKKGMKKWSHFSGGLYMRPFTSYKVFSCVLYLLTNTNLHRKRQFYRWITLFFDKNLLLLYPLKFSNSMTGFNITDCKHLPSLIHKHKAWQTQTTNKLPDQLSEVSLNFAALILILKLTFLKERHLMHEILIKILSFNIFCKCNSV